MTFTWAARQGISIDFIQPGQLSRMLTSSVTTGPFATIGSPHHLFETLDEIQEFATNWVWTYNHDSPIWPLAALDRNRNLPLPHNLYF